MPSPVAHALAGLTVHVLAARSQPELRDWKRALLITGAALAPDVDLLFRFVDGRNHHNNETHSIGAAVLAGLVAALALPLLRLARPRALALAVAFGWATHIVLDYLNRDTNPPIGLMALWPFSSNYYKFPWPIFLDIGRRLDGETIVHNLVAAAWEVTVLLPLLWIVLRHRSRRIAGE
ncbi:MAG TPA: metal-dependent hydrolase [Vicinamibacteria bacterium]